MEEAGVEGTYWTVRMRTKHLSRGKGGSLNVGIAVRAARDYHITVLTLVHMRE